MADTRKNTLGGGHIPRENLVAGLLDAFHCNTFDPQMLGVPFIAHFKSVAGTNDKTITIPKNLPCKVVNVWGYMTGAGGAGDTVQLLNGTNAITPAKDVSGLSDKDYFTFASIDDAYNIIASEGTLKLTTASDALCEVFVLLIRPITTS